MKRMNKTLCPVLSNRETEVYVGSAKCVSCKYYNGKLVIGEKGISCLMPIKN